MKALATGTVALVAVLAAAAVPAYADATNGGVAVGVTPPSRSTERPVLAAFSVTPSWLNPGSTPTVNFLVTGRAKVIRLRLVVSRPGATAPSRQIALGRFRIGTRQAAAVTALADPALTEGALSIRIAGRDSFGR